VSTDPPHTQSPGFGSSPSNGPGSTPGAGGSGQGQAPRITQPTAAHHDISTVLAREPCAGCGAPLGADQRYCLSCGIPRAGTRLPFLDVLHAEAASAGTIDAASQPTALLRMPALAVAASKGGGGGWWDGEDGIAAKLRENTGLFALLGVLLLALLIGLLLGHWVNGGSSNVASVPSKQVIEVKGLTTAAAAPAPAATAPASSAASEPSASSGSSGSANKSSAPTKTNSSPTVSKLAQSTGKEHAKEVEKALAKGNGTLSTGGASPPPKATSKAEANKPIGGGSEVTSIE
jgi:hypothetical protein